MKNNKMQKDLKTNQKINSQTIKSYDDLLRDEYTQTLNAVTSSESNPPFNSLIKDYTNNMSINSYTKSANTYKNNKKNFFDEEDLDNSLMNNEDAFDVAENFIDRTQFPLM